MSATRVGDTTTYDEVYPISLLASSLYKNTQVLMNQAMIANSDLYSYCSYLDILLHVSAIEQNTIRKACLCMQEDAHQSENDIHTHGLVEQYNSTKGGKTVELISKLNFNIFRQTKL